MNGDWRRGLVDGRYAWDFSNVIDDPWVYYAWDYVLFDNHDMDYMRRTVTLKYQERQTWTGKFIHELNENGFDVDIHGSIATISPFGAQFEST
jgi:hypothetical protein